MFYRLRGPEWQAAGLPSVSQAYELATAGKLNLVKDPAGRTGITRAELERYFAECKPLAEAGKRDTSAAVIGRKRRRAA
jgi:hypothetical protein